MQCISQTWISLLQAIVTIAKSTDIRFIYKFSLSFNMCMCECVKGVWGSIKEDYWPFSFLSDKKYWSVKEKHIKNNVILKSPQDFVIKLIKLQPRALEFGGAPNKTRAESIWNFIKIDWKIKRTLDDW